jgi:NAD(P)H-dependent FMN reductase
MTHDILVLVGSIRKASINLKLAKALVRLAPQELRFDFARLDDLPLFNQDLEQSLPPEVMRVRAQIEAARGLLFVTPEHNRSIPTALKNVIDWASRPYGNSLWPGSRLRSPALQWARSPPPLRRRICAQCWVISTFRHWASPRFISTSRTV